jgi:hypothetical protein
MHSNDRLGACVTRWSPPWSASFRSLGWYADASCMARHTYDRSVPVGFDPVLSAVLSRRLGQVVYSGAAIVGLEVLVGFAAARGGPPDIRWLVAAATRGVEDPVLWDLRITSTRLPLLALALCAPGLVLMLTSAVPALRRVRAGLPHGGIPMSTVIGVVLLHSLAPSLCIATVSSWANSEEGTLVAAVVPVVGSGLLAVALWHLRAMLDPWVWADPQSRRRRRRSSPGATAPR